MISNAITPYLDQGNITIGVLQQHEELYNSTSIIKNELGSSVDIIVLPKITNGPADTVYQLAKLAKWADEPAAVVQAAKIVAKGKPMSSDDEADLEDGDEGWNPLHQSTGIMFFEDEDGDGYPKGNPKKRG
jgi:hypothetical protein